MTMGSFGTLFLAVAVASGICNSYASIANPHIAGGKPWLQQTRPEVFDLNLYKRGQLIRTCKGSEISTIEKIAWLTAAECLDDEKYDEIEVKYLRYDKFYQFKYKLDGTFYHKHPQYNKNTGEHNIGLLRQLIHYTDNEWSIRRLRLPNKGENFVGRDAAVFSEYKPLQRKDSTETTYEVHAIQTKVIDPGWCRNRYFTSPAKDNNVCISGLYDKGLKKEDLGIPLVVREDDETYKIIGIAIDIRHWETSSNIEFLDIQPYMDWIQTPSEHYAR